MTIDKWANLATIGSFILPIVISLVVLFNRLMTHVKRLEEQYKPNGGSSLRDAIDRIEKRLLELDKEMYRLAGKFDQHIVERKVKE